MDMKKLVKLLEENNIKSVGYIDTSNRDDMCKISKQTDNKVEQAEYHINCLLGLLNGKVGECIYDDVSNTLETALAELEERELKYQEWLKEWEKEWRTLAIDKLVEDANNGKYTMQEVVKKYVTIMRGAK